MRPYIILIIILFALVYPSSCKEVAYAIGSDGKKPIGQANITDCKGTDVVSFTVSASSRGPSTGYKAQRTVDSIKEEINKKIDRGNGLVRDEGLELVGSKSGSRRIDQICSIYEFMVGNWTFVDDWRGLDEYQYSNYTLKMGNIVGSSGKGDCDDFSILLASLIESIGGTPRIILAYSPTGGHAYTEVYLGKMKEKDLDRMLRWLRSKYNVSDIDIHSDLDSNDVWLNMDWWKDTGGAKHPGGPFYEAATHIPIYIQEDMPKMPLTPIENSLPVALFSYNPIQPEVGDVVSFDASQSNDPDGKIVDYEWDFGDGETAHGITKSVCRHLYSSSGTFHVTLAVTDNDGDRSTRISEIDVTEPTPEAIIGYSPFEPIIGKPVAFDASLSKVRKGEIRNYEWDFGDGYAGKGISIKHSYSDIGTYNVVLTITSDMGMQNTSIINLSTSEEYPSGNNVPGNNIPGNNIPGNNIPGNNIPGNNVPQASTPALGTFVMDHTMASNVDESTNEVITRAYTFSNTDSKAYSWLRLGAPGTDTIKWMWYSPDGHLFTEYSYYISDPGDGYWTVWSYIYIVGGDNAANLPGDWHVDVYLNGQKVFTEYFHIYEIDPNNAYA